MADGDAGSSGAGTNWAGVGSGGGQLGAAVGDIFASYGDTLEARNYDQAAVFAKDQATYERGATEVKNFQQQRQIAGVLGGIQSDVGASGLAMSGSAQDVLRSSAQQGEISRGVTLQQGMLEVEGYNEQAASYREMAAAARNAAEGSMVAGIVGGIAGVVSMVGAAAA